MAESNNDDLVKIEKLTGSENFEVWKFQIKIVFKANGQWETVNGESLFTSLTKEEEKAIWIKKDARAQKTIVTTIEKKLLMHVLNCRTSYTMFKKLCDIFQKGGEQQKCNLLQEFFNFKYEKETDMSSHISQLENLACRLRAINQTVDEEMLISKILTTLPEEFKHFYTAWESTPKYERTLTNLTNRLIAEELRSKKTDDKESIAFKTQEKKIEKNPKLQERNCYNCGKPNHYAKDCRTKGKMYCKICKKNNHKEENCFFPKERRWKDKSI